MNEWFYQVFVLKNFVFKIYVLNVNVAKTSKINFLINV